MQSELAKAARDFMFLFIFDGGDRGISLDDIEPMELSQKFAALEAALSAAEPEEQDENPMRFFADNVDKWGALEWFNRLVDACEDHDRKRVQAFRCADEDEKDMLSLSADTSKMIMSSSAFQLARNHKDEIRSALSAQVQDVAGWQLVPKDDESRCVADSALPHEMIEAGIRVQEQVNDDHCNYIAGETTDWDCGMVAVAIYRAMLAAAPAKQEG